MYSEGATESALYRVAAAYVRAPWRMPDRRAHRAICNKCKGRGHFALDCTSQRACDGKWGKSESALSEEGASQSHSEEGAVFNFESDRASEVDSQSQRGDDGGAWDVYEWSEERAESVLCDDAVASMEPTSALHGGWVLVLTWTKAGWRLPVRFLRG